MRGVEVGAMLGIHLEMTKGDSVSTESHVHRATRHDLLAAMHGEAFAYASYTLFAEAARRNGRPEVARLFEETARTELMEHFAQQAELAGLVGTDADNLRTAIEAESYEVEVMYPSYAEHARAAGDTAAADRFEEVRRDEIEHLEAFRAALEETA
jgi:rubrerythrin